MNAKEFLDKFVSEVTENGKYKNYDKEGFTKGIVEKAMKKIIEEDAHLLYNPEYYTIDYTGWDKTEISKKFEDSTRLGFNKHYWNLKIAVEHENDPNDWNYEVFKLAPLKCPLRVVIGYTSKIKRAKEYSDEERLAYLASVLEEMTETFYKPQDSEEFMIIIGDNSKGGEDANYVGYLYENNTFVQLS